MWKQQIGLFQKITIHADGCKILIVQCNLAKLANSPNAPRKKVQKNIPLAWNYLILYGYDKWKYGLQVILPGKFHSKPIKALENSNLWTYPMDFPFFQKMPGILRSSPCMDIKSNSLMLECNCMPQQPVLS